jgi:phosphoheptose isomerase
MVRIYGEKDDVLVAISTSGVSENILSAIEAALCMNMTVIFLTGETRDDRASDFEVLWLPVESKDTPRIQEAHMFILHEIADIVEQKVG